MAERSREAISTIKGYYYQYDYFILQLLQIQDDKSVRIEGIEDVDILSSSSTEAVQCKYYDGTSCNPSTVAKAIRPMLRHFAKNKDAKLTYTLYGHYSSGEDSIPLPLTVEYVKSKFFTYTENQARHVLHEELGISDDDLEKFIKRLKIQLHADTYESQIETIIDCIQREICCSEFEARYFYYNNAVAFVKDVATNRTPEARTITKRRFLEKIKTKRALFDRWYIEYVSFEKYYKETRKFFFSHMNVSPKQRFFLIECDASIDDAGIVDLVMRITGKWSRLSSREKNPVCPYFYFHGITPSRMANVKKILFDDDFHIWDGYEYKDAEFSATSIARPVNYHMGVKAKIINGIDQICAILQECNGTKEIFQFYVTKSFFDYQGCVHKLFQVQNSEDVLKIV